MMCKMKVQEIFKIPKEVNENLNIRMFKTARGLPKPILVH